MNDGHTFRSIDELRFALPPSLGAAALRTTSGQWGAFLSERLGRPVRIWLPQSYSELERELTMGLADAAWAPPLICARVEEKGGRVLVRGVRRGASTYRSALVARKDRGLSLAALEGASASWTDRDSVAGFLLPRAFLLKQGFDPEQQLRHESFVGTYEAAVRGVLEGEADITATFASAENAQDPYSGWEQLAGRRAAELAVLAYTEECPNDAVVVAPHLDPSLEQSLRGILLSLSGEQHGRELMQRVFNADAFEPSPPQAYRALFGLLLATPRP